MVAQEHIYRKEAALLIQPFLEFALATPAQHYESIMMWLYAEYAHTHFNAFLPDKEDDEVLWRECHD